MSSLKRGEEREGRKEKEGIDCCKVLIEWERRNSEPDTFAFGNSHYSQRIFA